MNERINALWWKARIGYNNQSCDPEVLAKFAELLEKEFESKHFSAGYIEGKSDGIIETVHESCDTIERTYKYELGEKTQWAMSQDVQDLLKQHFGV